MDARAAPLRSVLSMHHVLAPAATTSASATSTAPLRPWRRHATPLWDAAVAALHPPCRQLARLACQHFCRHWVTEARGLKERLGLPIT